MARAPVNNKDIAPTGSPLRGSSRWFGLFSLLAALYLIFALSVPGAYLIAKQASVVVSSQLILSEDRSSSQQFGGNAGEDRIGHSWKGPKRLRGALLSPKLGINKLVNFLSTSHVGPTTLLERADSAKPVVAGEMQLPQDDSFPQEFLGRSPPPSR